MYIVEFKGVDVKYHACPKHLELAVAEKPKPKPLPVVDPKLTDLEREALERMLDDWVADGFTLQPFPEEYYSLFKKLGYKPTAAEYDWQCPNCMATMAGDLPVDRPSKCSNCGASMEPPAEEPEKPLPVITEAMAAAGLEKVFDKKNPDTDGMCYNEARAVNEAKRAAAERSEEED